MSICAASAVSRQPIIVATKATTQPRLSSVSSAYMRAAHFLPFPAYDPNQAMSTR